MELRHVCVACAEALAIDGVGLTLASRKIGLRELMSATDARSEELEEMQFTLGEGPGIDALDGEDSIMADLGSEVSRRRWPIFAPAAVELGVHSMFAIPVKAGAASIGVLDLYRDNAGPLRSDQLAEALAYADVALALALDRRGGIDSRSYDALDDLFTERRAEIHQAAGMVSVQLGCGVGDALARLRAYAYSHDRRLRDVAADILARELRFSADGEPIGPVTDDHAT